MSVCAYVRVCVRVKCVFKFAGECVRVSVCARMNVCWESMKVPQIARN